VWWWPSNMPTTVSTICPSSPAAAA
jgi:hypothetical protein